MKLVIFLGDFFFKRILIILLCKKNMYQVGVEMHVFFCV